MQTGDVFYYDAKTGARRAYFDKDSTAAYAQRASREDGANLVKWQCTNFGNETRWYLNGLEVDDLHPAVKKVTGV